jgi:hypothetical protein
MFESNFPVDKMAIGYSALWNAFKRIVAGASPDEKRSLFADTASRAYRLACLNDRGIGHFGFFGLNISGTLPT